MTDQNQQNNGNDGHPANNFIGDPSLVIWFEQQQQQQQPIPQPPAQQPGVEEEEEEEEGEEDDENGDSDFSGEDGVRRDVKLRAFLREVEEEKEEKRKKRAVHHAGALSSVDRTAKRPRLARPELEVMNEQHVAKAAVDWKRLPHEVILHLLEYLLFWWGKYNRRFMRLEEYHPMLHHGTKDVVGRFANDPFRRWHLIFRTIGFSIDNYFLNMSTHPFATFPMLSHVRHMHLIYPSAETDVITSQINRQTMPRLQDVVLVLEDFSHDQSTSCQWFIDVFSRESYAASKVVSVELPAQVNSTRQMGLLEHICHGGKFEKLKLISNLICDDHNVPEIMSHIGTLRSVEMICTDSSIWKLFLKKCNSVDSISLNISDTPSWPANGGEWFAALQQAKHVKRLSIVRLSIFHTFDSIPLCQSLTELDIGSYVESIRGISSMPHLERLRLVFHASMKLNTDDFSELGACAKLRHLAIFCSCRRYADANADANLSSQSQAEFFDTFINNVLVPNCTGLIRTLSLSTWMRITDKRPLESTWSGLARMQLDALHFYNFCLVDGDIQSLCRAYEMKQSVMNVLGISDDIGFMQQKGLMAILQSAFVRGLILDKEVLVTLMSQKEFDDILRLGLLDRLEIFGDE